MLAAKSIGYDIGPMGGFHAPLREALRIPERYVLIMIVTAGIAHTPAHSTTRLPIEEIVIHESFSSRSKVS